MNFQLHSQQMQNLTVYLNIPAIDWNSYSSPIFINPNSVAFNNSIHDQYEQLKIKYQRLLVENSQLKQKVKEFDIVNKKKRIVKRRKEQDIQRQISCPYPNCSKQYASEVALNLHIKQKHNGGTKKERERYARKIIIAQKNKRKIPESSIQLPPGYLQEFKSKLLDHVQSDSQVLYSSQST